MGNPSNASTPKKESELVHGVILGQERRNYLVDIGKTEALLPVQEQIPREAHRRGDRVRALLLEVRRTPKDVQVILSRAHPHFVVKLFGLEVPEISEKNRGNKRGRSRAWRSNENFGVFA